SQIERCAAGELNRPFSEVPILPSSGASATIVLDSSVRLTNENVLFERRNELIVLPLVAPVLFLRGRRQDLDYEHRIRDGVAGRIGGVALDWAANHRRVGISSFAGCKDPNLLVRLEGDASR